MPSIAPYRVRVRKGGSPLLAMPAPTPLANYDQQQLAAARTHLANERTLFTYVRTSLTLAAFGLTLLQLEPRRTRALGIGALATGAVLMAIGWVRFRYHARQIEASRLPPRH
ncbi:MAG: DUF202 domain-containing protein [Hymenobacter sp.]